MTLNRPKIRIVRSAALAASALALVAASACNFRYEKGDASRDAGEDTRLRQVDAVGFDRVNAEIFRPKCAGCHAERAPILTTYEEIVANLRDVEESVLVRKSMPKRGALAGDLRGMLRRWIDDGAPREAPGRPLPPPPAPPTSAAIPRPYTFANLKRDVLEPKCNTCHAVDNADGITEFETYASLASVKDFVQPLVLGHDGKNPIPADERMPPKGAEPLTDGEKLRILIWFADGALEGDAEPTKATLPEPSGDES